METWQGKSSHSEPNLRNAPRRLLLGLYRFFFLLPRSGGLADARLDFSLIAGLISGFFPNHFGKMSASVSGGFVAFIFGLSLLEGDVATRCCGVADLANVAIMSFTAFSGKLTMLDLGVNRLIRNRSTNDQVDDVMK